MKEGGWRRWICGQNDVRFAISLSFIPQLYLHGFRDVRPSPMTIEGGVGTLRCEQPLRLADYAFAKNPTVS